MASSKGIYFKIFLSVSLLLLASLNIKAQQLCLGIDGSAEDQSHSMVQVADGGYVLAGNTSSFGAGGRDVYVVKINKDGKLLWTKTIGGPSDDNGRSIVQTPDGGFAIAGWTNSFGAGGSDFYVVRLDANGGLLWTKTIGGSSTDLGYEIINTSDGGFAIAGQTSSFGGSPNDFYVVKLDGSGNLQWDKRVGGNTADIGYSIVQAADGGFAVCGSTYNWTGSGATSSLDYLIIKLDASGNLVWSRWIQDALDQKANHINTTSDGGFIVVGDGALPASSGGGWNWHIYGVKLTSTGTVEWSKYYGGQKIPNFSTDGSDYGESVMQTSDGGYLFGGWSFSFNYDFGISKQVSTQMYVMKVDATGNVISTSILGDAEPDEGKKAIITADGGVAITGLSHPAVSGQGTDKIYFVKLDASFQTCCRSRTGGQFIKSSGTPSSRGAVSPAGGTVASGGTEGSGGQIIDYCNTNLKVSLTPTQVKCKGNCNGKAKASAVGGAPPYSYKWENGSTTDSLTNLCPGIYKVVVTDNAGDKDSTTVTITEPTDSLRATKVSTDALCKGACNGTATVTAQGGTPTYTYSWNTNPAQNTAAAINLCAGNYIATITDKNGCKTAQNVTITEPETIVADTSTVKANCGNSDGSASVTVKSGGTGPFTFTWNTSPVQNTSTATNLAAGNYTCIITDAKSCSLSVSVIITSNGSGKASSSSKDVSCFGGNDGSITATLTGGTGPINYSWNTTPVQTTATAINLLAGIYTCTITDANNCKAIVTDTIQEPQEIILSSSFQNADCSSSNGKATATVQSGGTGPFSYSWNTNPVQTSATAQNLPAGQYTCTVTDAKNCSKQITVNIANNNGGTASGTKTALKCFGDKNASISVTMTGGTAPFSYSWNTSPAQNSAIANNLGAGIYTCTITDANNCVALFTDSIISPPRINLVISQTPGCGPGSTSANALVTGGQTPYVYAWSCANGNAPNVSGLNAGACVLTVTDAQNCSTKDTVTIINHPFPTLSLTAKNVTCNGGKDGTITANTSGGKTPFTYSWNTVPVQTTAIAKNLGVGNYTCVVTDSNKCTSTATSAITEPAPISLSWTAINPNCTATTGSAGVSVVSGGQQPFTYSWNTSPVQITATATNLLAGKEYICTVTDQNNCSSQITVALPKPLLINISHTPACGINSGSANTSVSGGTSPYTYQWSPTGGSQPNLSGVAAGTYSLTVTDAKGCSSSRTIEIKTLPVPSVDAGLDTTIIIGESVQLNANSTGNINWTPPADLSCTDCSDPVASPIQTTKYFVNVINASGCSATDSITVTVKIVCGEVFVPNAFSPNGEGNADNEKLCVYGNCFKTMRFMIFNRWGQKVYDSEERKKNCWDGTFNGEPMNSAVFVYYLEGELIDGTMVQKKGEINLIR